MVLYRCVLCGEAEGIPSHGVKDVIAVHPHVACERVADGVVAHVAHVQRAGWIGQHFKNIELLFCGAGLGGVQGGVLLPLPKPFFLDALGVVALVVLAIGGTVGAVFNARVGRRGYGFRVVFGRHDGRLLDY